jgi:hypothetical protein
MADNITGRDDYIITQALGYAIAFIDSLPEHERELSNRTDMVAILLARIPDDKDRELLARIIESMSGRRPDWFICEPEGSA